MLIHSHVRHAKVIALQTSTSATNKGEVSISLRKFKLAIPWKTRRKLTCRTAVELFILKLHCWMGSACSKVSLTKFFFAPTLKHLAWLYRFQHFLINWLMLDVQDYLKVGCHCASSVRRKRLGCSRRDITPCLLDPNSLDAVHTHSIFSYGDSKKLLGLFHFISTAGSHNIIALFPTFFIKRFVWKLNTCARTVTCTICQFHLPACPLVFLTMETLWMSCQVLR